MNSGFTGRCVSPERTVSRVRPFLPAMGITRIANVTGLDRIGIPVVMVTRPNSRSVSVSQGKGSTLAYAKASGVMEAIETYHAERIEAQLLYGSYRELSATRSLLDIERHRHVLVSDDSWDARLWIKGENIQNSEMLWLPYELVHLDLSVSATSRFDELPNSNGLASGNSLAEATLHGICEVVERDAMTMWKLLPEQAQRRTKVDLDDIADGQCADLLRRFGQAGVLVGVWECTSDVELPVFLCRILDEVGPPESTMRPAVGVGCHPIREVALRRALTEAAQSRLTFISAARDDIFHDSYDYFLDPETYSQWRQAIECPAGRRFGDCTTRSIDDADDGVRVVAKQLGRCGIDEIGVVDLTKSAFGIPVVRVVIPGLEGIIGASTYRPGPRAEARHMGAAA